MRAVRKDCDALGEKKLRVVEEVGSAASVSARSCGSRTTTPTRRSLRRQTRTNAIGSSWRRTVVRVSLRLVLGSETIKVLTHTHIPILVCR
jgi:hypothetical protein